MDLNVHYKTIKLLEKHIEENLQDLGFGKEFVELTPKSQFRKGKIDTLSLTKVKIFCFEEDPVV